MDFQSLSFLKIYKIEMQSNGAIRGISKTSLWRAWKATRQLLKHTYRRDALDFLEYDINPDVWINRILTRIKTGEYSPEKPSRYAFPKSKGFSRIITVPHIPDLVLYRTIVDHLFCAVQKRQKKHVYFSQSTLSEAV